MHLRKNNIRNKLLFLSRSIVRKTHPNAIHDILGISTNLIYDTALYETKESAPVSSTKNKQSVNWNTKKRINPNTKA